MTQHPPHGHQPPYDLPGRRVEAEVPKMVAPPLLPPPPSGPSIAERAERIYRLAAGQPPAEHVLEALHAGLDPEQEIRADALTVAARVLSGRDAYEDLTDVRVLDAAHATVALAEQFAAYIRDGSRPTDTAEEATTR